MVERTTENRSEEVQFFPKTIKTHNLVIFLFGAGSPKYLYPQVQK